MLKQNFATFTIVAVVVANGGLAFAQGVAWGQLERAAGAPATYGGARAAFGEAKDAGREPVAAARTTPKPALAKPQALKGSLSAEIPAARGEPEDDDRAAWSAAIGCFYGIYLGPPLGMIAGGVIGWNAFGILGAVGGVLVGGVAGYFLGQIIGAAIGYLAGRLSSSAR